jgi:5-methylcytosine-specific restriction endonuclease McrA
MRFDQGISHRALHKMFNGICALCNEETHLPEVWDRWDGKTWMPMAPTVDHIVPIARAGTHTWDNVQLAHAHCNSLKSAG